MYNLWMWVQTANWHGFCLRGSGAISLNVDMLMTYIALHIIMTVLLALIKLPFNSPFLSPLFFFCLVLLLFLYCNFLANGPFSKLCSRKLTNVFPLRVKPFCMALVEQLGDNSWWVVCAACCHMVLVFTIMHLYNVNKQLCCPFLFSSSFYVFL